MSDPSVVTLSQAPSQPPLPGGNGQSALLRKLKKAIWMIRVRPQGFWHFCLDTLSASFKTGRVWGKPVFISIEPTNVCDLECPVCETGAKVLDRPKGRMSLEHYEHLIDRIKRHTNAIQLYFMGEPFLHNQVYDMIRYAKDQGIFVNTYSNGSVLDPERTVASGLDEVNFNISGLTQETHQFYRINSNLEQVIANIKALAAARERFYAGRPAGTPRTPRISVGLIVMKQNEHEVDEFLRAAQTWGVDRAHVVDPCVRDMAQALTMLPENKQYWFYDEEAFKRGVLKPKYVPDNRCDWIYYSTMITWDGNVVPCCRDPKAKWVMGNVFKEDFGRIWNNAKYREFRRRIRTQQGQVDICRLCSSFPVPALYDARTASHETQSIPAIPLGS